MNLRLRLATTAALLLTLGAASAALDARARPAAADGLRAVDGTWLYVEDRTAGRALEQQGPPMSSTFVLRVEEDAVILVSGHGSGHKNVRVALDGSITEVIEGKKSARYRGAWKEGAFGFDVDFVREPGAAPEGLIRREFRPTPEGLLVSVTSRGPASVALYQHPEDIALPAPAQAAIGDLAWLAGAWVGTRGRSSTEERWSPPLGGAMLGTSRTVSGGKMSAFEFLRVVERDGGLVYVAQPGGGTATEFVLTEVTKTRAMFVNPRHDYPQRIVYELAEDGGLTATIGFAKGGSGRSFEFQREGG